ncbi:MAG: carboxypeptidase-like regulatory domain-containing protein, partial [Bacteroidota bacterium]
MKLFTKLSWTHFLTLLLLGLLLSACRKNEEIFEEPITEIPPAEIITTAILNGTVVDESNRPLPAVTVNIYENGQLIQQTLSDANGQFEFKALPFRNKPYLLNLEKALFSIINRSYQTTGAREDNITVQLPSQQFFNPSATVDPSTPELISVLGSIEDPAGNPAEGIALLFDLQGMIQDHVIADQQGIFEAFILPGQSLQLQVFSLCGQNLLQQSIGPNNDPIVLDPILSQMPGNLVQITGLLQDCSNRPTDGEIWLAINDNLTTQVLIEEDGALLLPVYDCQIASQVSAWAFNPTSGLGSDPVQVNYTTGNLDLGSFTLCQSSENFLEIIYQGDTTKYDNLTTVVRDNETNINGPSNDNGIVLSIPGASPGEFIPDLLVWTVDGTPLISNDPLVTFTQHDNIPF